MSWWAREDAKGIHTHDGAHELAVAVKQCGRAGEFGVEVVAALDEPLARRHLRAQRLALRALWVAEHRELALARRVGHARHLRIRVRDAVADDDRREVDVEEPRRECVRALLEVEVLVMHDARNARRVHTAEALGGDVEGQPCVLREAREEEL